MEVFFAQRPFVAFGASHLAVVILFALGVAALVWLGRRLRGRPAARRVSRAMGAAIALLVVPIQVYWMLPGNWDVKSSLPFQLCDLACLAAAWALWSGQRWACALSYYWGLTLTTQAIVTPALTLDFPHLAFIAFWGMHLLVVWAAVWLVAGAGFRPAWADFRFTAAATVAWGLCMLGFNSLTGANYLFVSAKPETASLLDALGPWPWYLLSELAIGLAVWALITWPWTRRAA